MANNLFKTGFSISNIFPGLSKDATDKIKDEAKKYSSDSYEQRLIEQELYQKELADKKHEDFAKNRQQMNMDMQQMTYDIKDGKQKNVINSQSRTGMVADMLREVGRQAGKNRDSIPDDELISRYSTKNPSEGKEIEKFISSDESQLEFARRMGYGVRQNRPQFEQAKEFVEGAVELAGGVGATYAGLKYGGKALQAGGKALYGISIDPSIKEATQIIDTEAAKMDAQKELKAAKSELNAIKKAGTEAEVKAQEEVVKQAEKTLEKASSKSVRTVADTAMEYNVGGGILEGWTDASRGSQAKSAANQIFKKTINPILEKSKQTINVQELINSLEEDVGRLAQNDPDKLKAYGEALKDLKNSYKAKEFANYSLKDAQTLKSGLQGRTPQKFFKGKEITNEVQELKGVLSTKIKNSLHDKLSEEAGENTAKLYRDWANLSEYKGRAAKSATNAGTKAGFGNFWSTVFHKTTDGATSKAGLVLDKAGKLLETATDPKFRVGKAKTLIKTIKKNPKVLLKSLKAIAPGDLLMPDFSYDTMMNKEPDPKLVEWVNKNRGDDMTEEEFIAMISGESTEDEANKAYNSLIDKGWTNEGIIALIDSIE